MQPPPNFHAAAPASSPRKGPSMFSPCSSSEALVYSPLSDVQLVTLTVSANSIEPHSMELKPALKVNSYRAAAAFTCSALASSIRVPSVSTSSSLKTLRAFLNISSSSSST
jgi:hypothetical protein